MLLPSVGNSYFLFAIEITFKVMEFSLKLIYISYEIEFEIVKNGISFVWVFTYLNRKTESKSFFWSNTMKVNKCPAATYCKFWLQHCLYIKLCLTFNNMSYEMRIYFTHLQASWSCFKFWPIYLFLHKKYSKNLNFCCFFFLIDLHVLECFESLTIFGKCLQAIQIL